jgi:pectate lyase
MPQARYGQVHVFNNYYAPGEANNSCVKAQVESNILVENNYFLNVDQPHWLQEGIIGARGNVYVNTTGDQDSVDGVFTPPYSYTLDAAEDVPAIVQAGAGPRP